MRLHFPGISKFNFHIPNPFRRREAAGGEAEPSSFNVLHPPTRDRQGAESPVGWHTRDSQILRIANPDANASPEHPTLTRIDTDVGDVPRIEIQSATTVGSPLSANPSLNRHHPGGSNESIGDYNPQWVGHSGGIPMMPVEDAAPHRSLHVVNGSPSTSGSSSPESVRSQSPESQIQSVPEWTDAFDPRQFPPPGGFKALGRNTAMRLGPDEAADRRQMALGRSIERPGAPRPDDFRNAPPDPHTAVSHGSAISPQDAATPAQPSVINFSRPFGPNNPLPGHVYGSDE